MTINQADFRIVNIIVISRLAYRKGIDLLVATAPRICKLHPNVRFIVGEWHMYLYLISFTHLDVIGGDGPKLIDLLQMRERHMLQDRIILRGPIKHGDVRKARFSNTRYFLWQLTRF